MTRVAPDRPVARREIWSWYLYDFADSAFTTVIVTAFYVLYFKEVVVGGASGRGDWYWGVANALSQVVVVLLLPLLGAIADHSARKLIFLRACGLMIILFTGSLFLVGPGMVAAGMVLFMLANVGFQSGGVFIDAFLPELARADNVGRLSGTKWGVGYVGGLLSLAAVAPLAIGGFGPDNLWRARLVFPVVALWYAVASLPAFLVLRERALPRVLPPGQSLTGAGVRRLLATAGRIRHYRELVKFLIAFWIYNDAIVTIIVFAAAYAHDTLGFSMAENLGLLLAVNIPAAIGSILCGRLVDRIGGVRTITLTLLLWLGVIAGTVLTSTRAPYYGVAVVAGLCMGSTQSASRSVVARFTPRGHAAEFFAFLGVAGKVSAIAGPLLFGLISATTGSQKLAVVAVGLFVLGGLLVLLTVDEAAGHAAAATDPA
ncbi:MAG: MFS transporter [Acidobacteriota bacterium]